MCTYYAVPTSSPLDVNALASDPTTLHLYWSPPPPENQNGDIIQYGINITHIEQGQTHQYNTSGPKTSVVIPDLHPYYTYQYMVTAFTVVGNGPYSPPEMRQMPAAGIVIVSVKTLIFHVSSPLAPSSAPLNLSLHEIGSSYALLRWTPPPESDRNGVIEHYQVQLSSSLGFNFSYNTAGSQTHLLLNSLQPSTQYTCSVAAVTVATGPASTTIHFTTDTSGTPLLRSTTGFC